MPPESMAEREDKKRALKSGSVWVEVKATYPKGCPERTTTTTLPMSLDEAQTLTGLLLRPGRIVAADMALRLHATEHKASTVRPPE